MAYILGSGHSCQQFQGSYWWYRTWYNRIPACGGQRNNLLSAGKRQRENGAGEVPAGLVAGGRTLTFELHELESGVPLLSGQSCIPVFNCFRRIKHSLCPKLSPTLVLGCLFPGFLLLPLSAPITTFNS